MPSLSKEFIDKNHKSSTELPEDIETGEIYMATCKTSGKSYIGQAKSYYIYYGKYRQWGGEKRWQSHIHESRSTYDHSKVLNSAIRKYGEDDFTLKILEKCKSDELDQKEKEYIEKYNTLIPNGYNIMSGGQTRTVSEEGKKKLIESRTGRKHSDETKFLITLSNILNRQNKDLPMFITKNKDSKYMIKYPVIDGYDISFEISKCDELDEAKVKVAEYEKLYDTTNKIKKIKEERVTKNKKKNDKIELPEYITPIYEKTYKVGYRVSNFKYYDDSIAQPMDFTNANINIRNLHNAKQYLKLLEIENKNKQFNIPNDLPNGIRRNRDINRVGTPIDGFKVVKGYKDDGTPQFKKFTDMRMSMEEKYKLANEFYEHEGKKYIKNKKVQNSKPKKGVIC